VTENTNDDGGVIFIGHYTGIVSTAPVDKYSAPSTSGVASPWASGAVTTSQSSELLIGQNYVVGCSSCSVTGSWTSDLMDNSGYLSGGNGGAALYSYQIVSAIKTGIANTGTSGSSCGANFNYPGIATFKGNVGSGSDTQAPSVPTGLTGFTLSGARVDLSWAAATDNVAVAGYYVYRNGSLAAAVPDTFFHDTTVSPLTTYTYTVAAYDAAGNISDQSSSFIITTAHRIFYIAASGSDANSGSTKTSPWLHVPGMPACANVCAKVIPAAGDSFILKGGDTWHFGNNSSIPYTGGTWVWQWNGSSGSPIYIGVDSTWYSGSSWSRPVLTADNPLTPHAGAFADYVPSCVYQIGSHNIIIDMSSVESVQHVILDNFELTGLCQVTANAGSHGGYDQYLTLSPNGNNTFRRLYIHGWTHLQFSCTGDGVGQCISLMAFAGGGPGDQILQCVIDGSDSDPGGLTAMFTGGYSVVQSVFRYTAQMVTELAHVWHDNLFEHWFEPSDLNAHGNLLESSGDFNGTNAVYNNVWRDICSDPGSCPGSIVGYWPEPPVGKTLYFFNNVYYGVTGSGGVEFFNIGQNGTHPDGSWIDQGPIMIFNNTLEDGQNGMFGCSESGGLKPFTAANNLYVLDASSPYAGSCASSETTVTNLLMTHATATADGYTPSETYAYSPTSPVSPTVGTGTDEQSYCEALATAALSDPTLADAAAACQSDASYGCTYNASNHTVTCPARKSVARPATGAWDIGAYQYTSNSI
jgi:hypothetical protein